MQQANLENFFNSEDGVIKNFNGKIRFCITVLMFCGIYIVLYLMKRILFYNLISIVGLSSLPIILLFLQNAFKHREARDNFFSGFCILILSLILWYSTVLLLCYQSDKLKYVIGIYFLLWLCCSVIVIIGILKNIKLDLYKPNLLEKQIKINKNYEVYLIWNKSSKIMVIILICMIIFQIIACKVLKTIFRSDLYLHILAVGCYLFGWAGLFGWKLLIKAFLLKKYTI